MATGEAAGGSSGTFYLQRQFKFLWDRKWSIIGVTILAVAAALLLTLRQPRTYESHALILVRPDPIASASPTEAINMETETILATSPEVADLVAEDEAVSFSGDPEDLLEGLDVTAQGTTSVLDVGYSSTEPAEAATLAQAFADGYLQYRLQQIADSVAPLQDQLESSQKQLGKLNDQRAETSDASEIAQLEAERATISGTILFLRGQLGPFASSEPLTTSTVGEIVREAPTPISPSSPQPVRNLAVGLLLGLALGAGVALLRDRLDDRLRDRDELEYHAGMKTLAVVPLAASRRDKNRTSLVTAEKPHSPAAEAYRTLRAAVLFAASQRHLKVLLVTSPNLQESRSGTTANLGVALAQAGKRVILVSADLRRPRLAEYFGVDNRTGVTSVLSGQVELAAALVQPGIANLRVLPSGPTPDNPTELLGSDAMAKLLAELREAADFVIVDVAPTLPSADAMTLAPVTDAVLVVADSTRTSRSAIQRTREQLDQVDARILGAVLNRSDLHEARSYPTSGDGDYASRHRPAPQRIAAGNSRGRTREHTDPSG